MSVWRWMTYNVLESNTFVVSSSNSMYPARRLRDRDFSSPWLSNDTLPVTVVVNQGALTTRAVKDYIISRHNLSVIDCDLAYSSDNIAYTIADTFTPTSAQTLIVRSLPSTITAQYWRFRTINPTIVQQIGELFLGVFQPLEVYHQDEVSLEVRGNADVLFTPARVPWVVERGDSISDIRRTVVVLPTDTATHGAFDQIEQMIVDIRHGKRPFWMYDERDRLYAVQIGGPTLSKIPLVPTLAYRLSATYLEIPL